ncbi:MAG: hypothetical protein V4858_14315 [Pseudomonadota bacterium]
MSSHSLDTQLDLLEAHLEDVAASLIGGSPAAAQASGATLQRLAVELIQMADAAGRVQLGSPQRMLRIKALAAGIATLRENLLRQLAYFERALEIVVPATREKATYAGSTTYGMPGRQSGAFKVLAA